MKKLYITLLDRLRAETPVFWKGVRKLSIALGVLGAGLIAAPGVPVGIVSIAGYIVTAGIVGTFLASLTKY